MPQVMAFVPLIMAAVSAVSGAVGSIMQSRDLKVQAKEQKQQGAELARRQRQKNEALTGEQVAKLGGSGVEILGSPADVIADDAGRGELAARDIEQGAAQRAYNLNRQAKAKKIGAYSTLIGGGLEFIGGAYEKSVTGSTSAPFMGGGGGTTNDFGLGGGGGAAQSSSPAWDTQAMSKRFSLVPGGASSGYGIS